MFRNSRKLTLLIASTAVLVVAAWPATALAATQPRLGTALSFAVLGGSTVTNTGPTVVTGELGLSPGTSVTGFPPGHSGIQHITDAVALQAQNDLGVAYTDAANAPTTSDLTGQNLGNKNLTPGVYSFSSSAQLTGPLTLSGNGVFIFQIGTTLTTASNAVVNLVNGAQACAVYWQVGSSATLGSATQFQGNLMAQTSITMVTGANILTGRALALTAAVTLDTNQITAPTGSCTVTSSAPTGSTPSPNGSRGGPNSKSPTPPTPKVGAGLDGNLVPGLLAIVVGGLLVATGRRRSHRDV